MNKMKKLIAVAMFIGLLGAVKVHAGVFSTTYTAVCINGSSPAALSQQTGEMELLWISFSSASAVQGDSFLLLFDTPSIYCQNTPLAADPVPQGVLYATGGNGRWLPNQQLLPPIVMASSSSIISGQYSPYFTWLDFRDAQGNGIPITNNLTAFKNGTDYGTTVTYGLRKRRTSVEH